MSAILSSTAFASSQGTSPTLEAKSWAMLDARSGQIIAEHNADEQLPPASLTKMMTLYLAFEAVKEGRLDINERIKISKKAWKIGGSTMFLEPRLNPTVNELLHGIATLSGNDACIAIAEHMDGSEESFADRMNEKAKALGMQHSHFSNATGFPAESHYSSAMDMSILGVAIWRDYPEQYKLFGERDYTFDGHTQPNRNRLLWSFPDADGIKTGHTKEAGYCLVGSAEKNNTRFVTAVFGTNSDRARARESKKLLGYGFRNFITVRPTEREIRRQVEVFEGVKNSIWLKPTAPIWVTVPQNSKAKLSFRLRYDAPLKAPIREGQKLGTIEAVIGGDNAKAEVMRSFPMVATQSIKQASWISRQWDGLRLWISDSSNELLDDVTGEPGTAE
ncbi:D-alanyl-D-alanine carboxypeptidase [Mariprofundus sp. EBB-1]|uniref:D-alanyl-D-alanine carboxypeptidase family protein n=1 Tax=Mariprofundus sp. EBB-1 TaxID=2650971 RepID=UPI000EF25524|nr:D-alanyl-D-alanine carboxypeptidase family protein [Mariprofundus sp. EBB-1]RLL50948.1 D-alanyl-D-alanine carboxypeptidase [Mariprofundus sp. EBB-1]